MMEPLRVQRLTFRNRVLRSSLGGKFAYFDGSVNNAWKSFEKRFARSGVAGLISATITVALERYAADTRLRLLGAAVDSATVGIALVDVRGEVRQVVFANASYLVKRGLDRGAVLGKAPRFPGGAGSPEVTERIEAAIQARQRAEGVLERIGADGARRWCSITLSPVANRTGQITHVLVFELDITRQRQAEAALAESQRLEVVGRLTATLPRDENAAGESPLGQVVADAQLAATAGAGPGTGRHTSSASVLSVDSGSAGALPAAEGLLIATTSAGWCHGES
jgi:PAS domain S-box-containing protein